jgi:Protein kinase domain/PEGA domain
MTVCPQCASPVDAEFRYCPACGADTTDPGTGAVRGSASDLLQRQLIAATGDRFEIHSMLGRGGMGAVFLATEKKLGRKVAIKVLPPEYAEIEEVAQRFAREARTAAQLDHPNIVPIYSVEDEGPVQYFVMKYVNGHPLDQGLTGAQPWRTVRDIVYEAAVALGHAHARGIVHRDVKPGNIMLDEQNRVLLADFGISKAAEGATFTATGTILGTPAYMSPEQAQGQPVDGRSDQYSLGVVAYSLLAGRLPFQEASVPTYLYMHAHEPPPPLQQFCRDAPPYLTDAVMRSLAKNPDDRFPSMEAFAAAIHPERSAPVGGAPPAAGRRTAAPRPVWRRPAVLLGALALCAAAVGAIALWPRATPQSGTPTAPPVAPAAGAVAGRSSAAHPGSTSVAPSLAPSRAAPRTQPASRPVPSDVARRAATTTPPKPSPPAAETASTAVPAPPSVGYLTVGASPWGTVVIDGVEAGNTPLTRHQLPPGTYRVQVRRVGYATTTDSVTITAGNGTILRKVLVPQP